MAQAILFDRLLWTRQESEEWLLAHGYRHINEDYAPNHMRRYDLKRVIPGHHYIEIRLTDDEGLKFVIDINEKFGPRVKR